MIGIIRLKKLASIILAIAALVAALGYWQFERYSTSFDAEYVGAATCGDCHTQIYPEWQMSSHANMLRRANRSSVVGDFDNATWSAPQAEQPSARMFTQGNNYFMAFRESGGDTFHIFPIEFVVGYQYRQVYLTREDGGVLRRLPLQWSVRRQAFFPYWNLQEQSTPSTEDLWAQMRSQNSAWNLFCARCHTTHLQIHGKNVSHTMADVEWTDRGIACEACHGPGSLHAAYFDSNYVNRVAGWINDRFRDQPVAYVANARKLDKGRAMSVCGRCHGADIYLADTDIYRNFEPGYSRVGRTNDLSDWFRSAPLTPDRNIPTLETYDNGEPKGIGMLFRSLIESACYQQAEVRCFDCHNPHDNRLPAKTGALIPSDVSNNYCLGCHEELRSGIADHTQHTPGSPGSYCYDCHMPKIITKLATGVLEKTRTHRMSLIPVPPDSLTDGPNSPPSACLDCHGDTAMALPAD